MLWEIKLGKERFYIQFKIACCVILYTKSIFCLSRVQYKLAVIGAISVFDFAAAIGGYQHVCHVLCAYAKPCA